MTKQEILDLITSEFSNREYDERLSRVEKKVDTFFPVVKSRPKRVKKRKVVEYIEREVAKTLK